MEKTKELIEKGIKFDLEFLEDIYHDNLNFARIDKQNNINAVLIKEDNKKNSLCEIILNNK